MPHYAYIQMEVIITVKTGIFTCILSASMIDGSYTIYIIYLLYQLTLSLKALLLSSTSLVAKLRKNSIKLHILVNKFMKEIVCKCRMHRSRDTSSYKRGTQQVINHSGLRGHRLGYRLGQLVSQSHLWQGESRPSGNSICRSLALVRSCLGHFLFIPTFFSSIFLPLAFPMREVYCAGYIPRARDPCSRQSILNGLLYFGLWITRKRWVRTALD